jgi:hypothetical protein
LESSYGITNYGVEVTFNGINPLLNFIQNVPIISKVDRGDIHRRDGHLISLLFFVCEGM